MIDRKIQRKEGHRMQKVLINFLKKDEDKIIHILKANDFELMKFDNEEQVLLLLELYDCQMSLLINIIHELPNHQDISINMCHQVPFYD